MTCSAVSSGCSATHFRASAIKPMSTLYTASSRGFLDDVMARLMMLSSRSKPLFRSLRVSMCIFDDPMAAGCRPTPVEVFMSAVKVPNALKSVRGPYDFDTADFDPGIDCSGYVGEHGEWFETPSLTKQADAEDCDINVMMAKYQATGVEPRVNPRAPQWGDFSTVIGFQDALNVVRQSEADFALLPAEVRERFGNNPAGLLEFLADEGNRAEAERLGIVMPVKPPEPPLEVRVVESEGRGDASPPKGSKEPVAGA